MFTLKYRLSTNNLIPYQSQLNLKQWMHSWGPQTIEFRFQVKDNSLHARY